MFKQALMVGALTSLVLISAASTAKATVYNFAVNYSGNSVGTLAAGSDDPLSTTLVIGDTFTYTLKALNGGAWTTAGGNVTFPLDAYVSECGYRTSDATLTLSNNNSGVFSAAQYGVYNSCIHLGVQGLNIPALVFDQLTLTDTILDADVTSTFGSLLPIFGPPEVNWTMFGVTTTYAETQVPVPAALSLLGMGLAAFGVLRRRKSA